MFLFSRSGPPALTDKNYYAYFISIQINYWRVASHSNSPSLCSLTQV